VDLPDDEAPVRSIQIHRAPGLVTKEDAQLGLLHGEVDQLAHVLTGLVVDELLGVLEAHLHDEGGVTDGTGAVAHLSLAVVDVDLVRVHCDKY